ncbi:Phage integrase family protein [Daejeonella rubra]|uniref:Phage integrase family protein n=1 Tax=Daejeonella rubra TaxID=990371 RepID=A0A1G9YWF6_9SPHI|nr:site-specific integrase [Daejeonella rubra]SDN13227.1 Phage integrase family protein [Daejeonella rubra]
MVYYKLILDTKRIKEDGLYTIVIRITHNRNNTTITTGLRVKLDQWDSTSQLIIKSHPNFQKLNSSISELYLKIQKIILALQESGEFSFEKLKDQLSNRTVIKVEQITFHEFSNKLIKDMIQLNQTGNALIYQTALNRFMSYSNKSIKFQDIDYNLLSGYKNSLLSSGVKQNTISNYFRTIKAIYNKGIKAKIVDRAFYPFYDITVKQERTSKRSISLEAIKNIMGVDLELGTAKWHSWNYFMLSFCLIGISFTDLAYLKTENIIKDRLAFRRRKTHKLYNIKITGHALSIFSIYKGINSNYLLPILPPDIMEDTLEAKKLISQWIKTTNKYLKRVGKDIGLDRPLTTYVARHTWATTAKKLGYSNELIAEAMGHEFGNKTTAIYLDTFDKDEIDKMNETICQVIVQIINHK